MWRSIVASDRDAAIVAALRGLNYKPGDRCCVFLAFPNTERHPNGTPICVHRFDCVFTQEHKS